MFGLDQFIYITRKIWTNNYVQFFLQDFVRKIEPKKESIFLDLQLTGEAHDSYLSDGITKKSVTMFMNTHISHKSQQPSPDKI
jgi:hypothetical protein